MTLHFAVNEEVFAPDQIIYHSDSLWLAQYWSGQTLMYPPRLLQPGPTGYFYVVAFLYSIFGGWSLVPKVVNAVIGGLAVPLVYNLSKRIAGSEEVAMRAAKYAAYFPSLVLWSSLNIRDVWVILLILVISAVALSLREQLSIGGILLLSASLFALTTFRDYIFFAIAAPLLVSFVFRGGPNLLRNVLLGMMFAFVVIYASESAGAQMRFHTLDLEELSTIRRWNAVGAASGFGMAADISTPTKAISFLPIGLAYFLFAPFPWAISGVRQILAVPETLFFYSLVPNMIRGVRTLLRDRLQQCLMVVLLSGGLTVGYALGEGNAGTAYRHRAQILCFYLLFAAVGLEVKARRVAQVQMREGAGFRGLAPRAS